MPAITRKDVDLSAGHSEGPPVPAIEGSPNVKVNGHLAVRVGDNYQPHSWDGPPHSMTASAGSATVIINGKQAHRIGDALSDGDVSAAGSPNVLVGSSGYGGIVKVEPGVFLVRGGPVFDNSKDGQKAIVIDEVHLIPEAIISPSGVVLGTRPQETATDSPADESPEPTPTSSLTCDQLPDQIGLPEMKQIKVSKYFYLSHCRNLPVDQRGLTAKQIACNWMQLCQNILDPISDNFTLVTPLNSAFRTVASGMGNSDHGLGCAADVTTGSVEGDIALFKWLQTSGLPFSQMIYEKRNTSWVHVSHNGKKKNDASRIMLTLTGRSPYTSVSSLAPGSEYRA